jgi:salicylate hydroxylase
MHALVVGAGIGGLVTALACRKAGIGVTLLEQAAALKEVGAGVQISSNGSAVLRELGLAAAVAAVAVRPVSFRVLSFESGEVIADFPLGPEAAARYGATFYQLHRADLLAILAEALPPGVLRLGARVVSIAQDAAGVGARLASGEEVRGDLLVGADGIHSAVRQALGITDDRKFSGKLVWRALVPADRIAQLDFKDRFYGYAGRDRMVWAYWVRPRALFNFGGVVPSGEVHAESWSASGELADLRASFAGANPRLARLIEAVEAPFITGLYDRDPLARWSFGRVTLLGDAAHAMLPYLAQGACQSIEDAFVLAECLKRGGETGIEAALADYEIRRRPRTTKVQATARATSIFWLEKDPVRIRARDGRMKGLAQIDPLATTVWKWLYGHDAVAGARADTVPPDKRGLRRRFAEDSPEQQRAWDMWHDLFTVDEEAGGLLGLRKGYDRFFKQFAPSPGTKIASEPIGAAAGLWVDPAGERGRRIVLHLHGGGYCFGSAACSVEYAERLARAARGRCLALEYRLAPEHSFPAGLEDALAAYRWLRARHAPADILFSGESAGAGLAIAAAMALRDAGEPLPAGIVALSPFVDCALAGEAIHRRNGEDPIVEVDTLAYMVSSYFQERSPVDPLVSPIYGDFRGLPPMLVQAGAKEVLVEEAVRLVERAKAHGVAAALELYDERLHIFSLFPFLPNAARALASIAAFVARLGSSPAQGRVASVEG